MRNRYALTLLAVLAAASADAVNAAAITTFSAAGANRAAIQSAVDSFRDSLGDLNPFVPQQFADGRRQINWDAAPAAVSSPNAFPGDFFNFPAAPRARGIEFATPGSGFQLSGDSGDGTPLRFEDINPTYADEFQAFSPERLFTPIDSTKTKVTFYAPDDPSTPATTDGFGAVFVDVDTFGSSTLEFYDVYDNLLLTTIVPEADQGLSFAAAQFDYDIVASVMITSGSVAVGPDDGAFGDVVVLDDFIFGEPTPISAAVPEPGSLALLVAIGLAGLARRRRR